MFSLFSNFSHSLYIWSGTLALLFLAWYIAFSTSDFKIDGPVYVLSMSCLLYYLQIGLLSSNRAYMYVYYNENTNRLNFNFMWKLVVLFFRKRMYTISANTEYLD